MPQFFYCIQVNKSPKDATERLLKNKTLFSSLATKWKRVKRGGTTNTSCCLSFQKHTCMLTVIWTPVVSWREAVSLTRVQSLLSSSSILSSFFSSSLSSLLFLLLNHRFCYFLFVISLVVDVDECTASTPVCVVHFNCTNALGSYLCEYNHSCCQGKKSIHHLFILMINLVPRALKKKRDWFVMTQLNPLEERWNHKCRG